MTKTSFIVIPDRHIKSGPVMECFHNFTFNANISKFAYTKETKPSK